MTDHTKHAIVHAFRHALETETGKQFTKAVAGTAVAATTAVLGPTVAAVVLPVAVVGGLGYCLYRAFKD
jgi:hypothetical protein